MIRGVQTKATEQQRDAMLAGVFGALASEALLSRAASLARKGEYAAAESLLKQLVGSENESPRTLDLLARIHAQQGRFSEAEAFWKRALEVEPNNEFYLAGLNRIAQMRSRPPWASVLLPMAAAFIATLAVCLVGFVVRDQIVHLRESLLREVARANSDIVEVIQKRLAKTGAETATSVPSTPQITIQLNGATVKTQHNTLVVLFDEGLFLSRAHLKPEAKTLLSELGKQLQPYGSNISIRVVGHTDDTPVPKGWVYRDNAHLRLVRSVTVANYLSYDAELPLSLFLLQSAGESQPPYPNDTPANRLRNRTVVIHISPVENRKDGKP